MQKVSVLTYHVNSLLKTATSSMAHYALKKLVIPLIICVHGFASSQREHIIFTGCMFFSQQGFDTFRFDLYSSEEKGRRLEETNLSIHANDLSTVINQFKTRYTHIFLIGHSLGGPVIGLSDLTSITSICLWDPRIRLDTFEEKLGVRSLPLTDYYLLDWGATIVVNKKIFSEWKQFDNHAFVKSLIVPVKITTAKVHCWNYQHWPEFLPLIPAEYAYHEIDHADHYFDTKESEQELFDETLLWFNNNREQ